MKSISLRISLAALAVFASVGMAEAAKKSERQVPLAETQDSGQQIVLIRQFLAEGKDLSKMRLPRLQGRLHRAEEFRGVPGLPPDLDQALQQEIARITQEITSRQQGAAAAQQPEQQAQQPSEPQLEDPPLPPYDPSQAQGEQQAPAKRKQQQQQAETPQPPPEAPPASQAGSQEVAAFLQSVRPASELNPAELRQQMRKAVELSQGSSLSAGQRQALRGVIRDARAVLDGQPQQAQQPAPAEPQPPPPVAQQTPQPEAHTSQQPAKPGAVNPVLEQRAQAYLNDTADVRSMKRKQLRKRLSEVRDLLASNKLSPQTREAVRQKLASERAVLRNDVAADEGLPPPIQQQPPQPGQQPAQQQGGTTNNSTTNNTTINNTTTNTDVRVVLEDRRPPQQLDDRDLVRRIDIYRGAVADERYDAEQRMMWRRQMEEDRRYLRRQMIEERQQREARLSQGDYQFNLDVQDRYEPGYDVPDDVFAAEADDEEIADVLAAPPRRQIERRYSVEDFERYPDARNAVARIEIDTVHFGFGEGYLREEEIDKLDRIATVLEKILAAHPEEVFLIEGHTDAVGSDSSNLQLSRQRAAAVKDALTTYYVIPPENLKTVGLGERYLKIPTDQPEAENRRVSLARITPLVGRAD